jgi:hypothetical protein
MFGFRAHVLLVTLIMGMLSSCGGSLDNSNSNTRRNKNSISLSKDNELIKETASVPPAAIKNAHLIPATLSYDVNERVFTVGQSITPLIPRSTGGLISHYEATTPLPLGLNLNSVSGVISGTPTLDTPKSTYTITAKNNSGQVTRELILTVQDQESPPTSISYNCTVCNISVGQAITPLAPNANGGQVNRYTVSPELPAGLVLHSTTGIISGTPTAEPSNASFTVTASNNVGKTTTILMLATLRPILPTSNSPTQPK